MAVSISLRRAVAIRNSPLLSDLYLISTLRVGRSAILRLDGTRPNRGVMLRSRILCRIRPDVAFMEVGLAEFLVSPTVRSCCRCGK